MRATKPYWFPAKTYGWGWGLPTAWQGWVVMAVYLVGLVALVVFVNPAAYPLHFPLGLAVLSAALVGICWKTGEPPRWRWGKR